MKEALALASYQRKTRKIKCTQTGEVATAREWSTALAAKFKIKQSSAYKMFSEAVNKGTPVYGLEFEVTQ